MSDPKGAAGAGKLPFAALPWAVVAELAVGMGEGAVKYGAHNWRTSGGVNASTYRAAAMRHLVADMLGEEIDPDSGLPHVVKAMSSLAVLRDARIHGVAIEDGPPASPPGLLAALNDLWGDVRGRASVAAVAPAAPPPCGRCGGAGRVPRTSRHHAGAWAPCPACQARPHDALSTPPRRRRRGH